MALYPDKIKLMGLIRGSGGKLFGYMSDPANLSDGKFSLYSGGTIFSGRIDPNVTYQLVMFIKDGGEFDLDGQVNGSVISSVFLAAERKSGGGCNAFNAGLSVLLLSTLVMIMKRR